MDDDTDSARSSHHSPEKDVPEVVSDEPQPEKKLAIENACARSDVLGLRALAESAGGFLSDDIRRQACTCFWPRSSQHPLHPC